MDKQIIKYTQTAADIEEVTTEIRELLIRKNESYGDSALSPRRICSKAPLDEQIKVRIDDKLNRLAQGNGDDFNEDVTLDLLGYLILLRISQKRAKRVAETIYKEMAHGPGTAAKVAHDLTEREAQMARIPLR